MFQIGRKIRTRRVPPVVRLRLEHLERRDLLSVPIPPAVVAATGTSASGITVNWNASTDHSVTGYDVYEKIWFGVHAGYWRYVPVGTNLKTTTETITGLTLGSTHNYVVTDVNPSGQSPYSYTATARTWFAPRLTYESGTVQLSDGTLSSNPVRATATLTTEFAIGASGNPLTFSVVSGPANLSINSKTGVVTFAPIASEVGTFNATFKVANALGSITQTVQINVAAYPSLAKPTLKLISPSSSTYNGKSQYLQAEAVGTDGVTPLAGAISYSYSGNGSGSSFGPGAPSSAGIYKVLVTFTSGDPKYGNATLMTTDMINKAAPTFSGLTAETISQGDSTTRFFGSISSSSAPIPAGEFMIVTLNGVSEATTLFPNGSFAVTFDTSGLAVGTYTVSYTFWGDTNFAAANNSSTLKVIPTALPTITQNPSDTTTTAGDYASFTASATGSPSPSVQWQVSTDGGVTWTNITGNASAQTDTLTVLATSTSMTGYEYRAVFTSRIGTATTTAATLTVESD
jgi:hypothetical protein